MHAVTAMRLPRHCTMARSRVLLMTCGEQSVRVSSAHAHNGRRCVGELKITRAGLPVPVNEDRRRLRPEFAMFDHEGEFCLQPRQHQPCTSLERVNARDDVASVRQQQHACGCELRVCGRDRDLKRRCRLTGRLQTGPSALPQQVTAMIARCRVAALDSDPMN